MYVKCFVEKVSTVSSSICVDALVAYAQPIGVPSVICFQLAVFGAVTVTAILIVMCVFINDRVWGFEQRFSR